MKLVDVVLLVALFTLLAFLLGVDYGTIQMAKPATVKESFTVGCGK